MNPLTFLVAPEGVMARYLDQFFKMTADSAGLRITGPMHEAAGVTNRRALVAHPLDADQIAYAHSVVDANGDTAAVQFLSAVPADWRFA